MSSQQVCPKAPVIRRVYSNNTYVHTTCVATNDVTRTPPPSVSTNRPIPITISQPTLDPTMTPEQSFSSSPLLKCSNFLITEVNLENCPNLMITDVNLAP